MEKRKVSVFVAGQRFNLITDEEERYVIDLAAKVDARISSLSISQSMTRERAAVLTALDLADDIEQGKRSLNEVKEQVKDYLSKIEELTTENTELRTQLSREKHDSMALSDVQRLLAESDQEKDALKRQILAMKEQITVMQQADDQEPAAEKDSAPQVTAAVVEDTPAKDLPVQAEKAKEPAPAVPDAPAEPAVTAEDDLFFGIPEDPRPRKEKKRHHHPHENPYRQQHLQKKGEQKGYTQQRQYSFFDDDTDT